MAYTTHGHHIMGTTKNGHPDRVARCGGPGLCPSCSSEALVVSSNDDFALQRKAQKIVNDYVKSWRMGEPGEFGVYVVWFSKTLQHWKAMLSTTLPDGMYYEVTYNGDKREAYLDSYSKSENTVIKDV